ncbi:hypothetical protein F5884DRAFT_744565 [Xylogone sp. PMI_703]|nr:hypothetical protein F5884DRAFT_744565 [Xylogone sp. PMI_703]
MDSSTDEYSTLEPYTGNPNLPEVTPSNLPEHYKSVTKVDEPVQAKQRPRKFIIITLVAAIIVIAAVIGGTVGGILGHRHASSSTSPTCSNINIACDSALTATNRTDANGYAHRTVCFQDANHAIIARSWDLQNRAWTTTNITDYFNNKSTPLPGPPMPGTPLASASMDGDSFSGAIHLWYLGWDRSILSIYLEPDTGTWTIDNEFNDAKLIAGSALAAAWQRPTDNSSSGSNDGYWIVTYQSPLGDILAANSSHWATPIGAVVSSDVSPNSSLALVPQLNGGLLDGLALTFEYNSTPSKMELTTMHATWDHSESPSKPTA